MSCFVSKKFRNLVLMSIFVASLALLLPGSKVFSREVSAEQLEPQVEATPLYLPLVVNKYPIPISVFGVEVSTTHVEAVIDEAARLEAPWVRYNGINWNEVEPVPVQDPNGYNWSALSSFEFEIELLASRGLTPLVIIRGTPAWARMAQYPDSSCSPVRQGVLDDYAIFVSDMVRRYSKAPYNVKYWELGNEPDVDPSLVDGDSVFGCWGNKNDPYYGGGYYATMLQWVYPAIKQADPSAQVLIGGLLLDCDPTHPPAGKDCKPAKFLEGILLGGGGAYFDMVAYHAYSYWGGLNSGVDWDLLHSSWSHRGGALLGKLDFIRSVLNTYGHGHKSILMNEGVLLCSDDFELCKNDGFYNAQANYAIRLYTRAKATELRGVLWYTLNGPGWRYGGLLDATQQPRPVFETFNHLVEWLSGTVYQAQLATDPSGLEGYQFYKPVNNHTYQIYWVNSDVSLNLSKPANTIAVYDKLGNDITPTGNTVEVSFEPIIIEIVP